MKNVKIYNGYSSKLFGDFNYRQIEKDLNELAEQGYVIKTATTEKHIKRSLFWLGFLTCGVTWFFMCRKVYTVTLEKDC